MAVRVVGLFLLVLLPKILASEIAIESTICGEEGSRRTISSRNELFCIDGCLIDANQYCKAVNFCNANNCSFQEYVIRSYCGFDRSLVTLPLNPGRKLLQKLDRQYNKTPNFGILPVPKMVAMGGLGIFLICCAVTCPCFRPKMKENMERVIVKEPSSTHSISSIERTSTPEKVPASPLRVPPSPSRFSMSPKPSRLEPVNLNMNQVMKATQNFSPSLIVGEGGFGTVYKAQLQNGQVVAIKRAKKEFFDALQTEFSSEVELLAKIDHKNLVKLLGCIDKGKERLIVTEYVPNGTLREHLDGRRGKILDFNRRLEISIDVAHALTYLHLYAEKSIIHRDVKSSNILLTESLRPKVADFGFAKAGPMDSDRTHISTKVKGTIGYLDPEYMKTNQLTTKSDVYSFGILLIEILSGRRPVEPQKEVEEKVTLRWAFRKYDEGSVVDLLDPLIGETVDTRILKKMFGLAIQCAAPIRNRRPDMKWVSEQLWGIRMDYLKTVKRGQHATT